MTCTLGIHYTDKFAQVVNYIIQLCMMKHPCGKGKWQKYKDHIGYVYHGISIIHYYVAISNIQ